VRGIEELIDGLDGRAALTFSGRLAARSGL
jgi:hypothetical protein